MTVNITESAISLALKKAKETGKRQELIDSVQDGLRIRVSPTGKKSWSLSCRDLKGAMRRFPLGSHPSMGLSVARTAARALHTRVKLEGADPIAERRKIKTSSEVTTTLRKLLIIYERDGGASGKKSWHDSKLRINSVFEKLLDLPLSDINRSDLQIIADTYVSKSSASAAVRYLRPILKWGSKRDYNNETLASIEAPIKVSRRTRVLSVVELQSLLPIISISQKPSWQVLYFILLTLARREEVARARWKDIDWANKTWNIDQNKTNSPTLIPLSEQAIQFLKNLFDDSSSSNDLIFCTKTGNKLANWDRETKLLFRETATSGWHRHDLRRTAATVLGDLGEIPDFIEAALNHKNIHSSLASNYNRSRYLPQVRTALQKLANYYDEIIRESVV